MRIDSGKPCKNGGHFHPLNGEYKRERPNRPEPPPPPEIDAKKLMEEFSCDTQIGAMADFASKIGVTLESLQLIGCQRAVQYWAWAFPMYGAAGQMVGIRLRHDNGKKDSVSGSKNGIFMANKEPSRTAYIVEGVSDLAALLSMGLFGFGRPQCCGCIVPITSALSRLRINRVVIVTDNDEPGLNGAKSLVRELNIPSVIFVPPAKDLREAFRIGLTTPLLESLVNSQVWTNPKAPSGQNGFAPRSPAQSSDSASGLPCSIPHHGFLPEILTT